MALACTTWMKQDESWTSSIKFLYCDISLTESWSSSFVDIPLSMLLFTTKHKSGLIFDYDWYQYVQCCIIIIGHKVPSLTSCASAPLWPSNLWVLGATTLSGQISLVDHCPLEFHIFCNGKNRINLSEESFQRGRLVHWIFLKLLQLNMYMSKCSTFVLCIKVIAILNVFFS